MGFSKTRRTLRVASALALITAGLSAGFLASPTVEEAQANTPKVYYVKANGNDSADGLSQSTAWKSLSKVSSTTFNAGDTIRFRRGDTFQGELRVDEWGWSSKNITFNSYGSGNRPIITGSCLKPNGYHLTFQGLHVKNCPYDGAAVYGQNVSFINMTFEGNAHGITAYNGSHGLVVTGSSFINNNKMVVNTPCSVNCNDDYGASGIVVWSNNALIDGNTFTGHVATSPDYGQDGSSVELYGAQNATVKNNTSTNDLTFTELGSDTWNGKYASGNSFTNNRATSTLANSSFLITRGGGVFGPVYSTTMNGNTGVLTGNTSVGIYCEPTCNSNLLTASGNKIVSPGPAIVSGSWSSSNNRYCGEWHNTYVKGSTDVQKTYTVTGAPIATAEAGC